MGLGPEILKREADYLLGSNESNLTCGEDVYSVPATLYRKVMGTVIFLIIWPFIVLDMKWFPISRPAAALLGATFMVIFTVVPQDQAFIVLGDKGNLQTICLLLGMMLLSYYYDREGLLRFAALWIFGQNKPFKHVLWKVCALSAILSAIITNDATCLLLTPVLVREHKKQKRSTNELPPLLLGIASSANIGSASTFFGNPQNAFIAANSKGEVSLLIFFVTSLPPAILGMFLSVAFLYLLYFRVVFVSSTEGTDATDPENAVDQNRNEYSVTSLDPQISVTSLHESRENLARSYDRSADPFTTSQVAYERQKLYTTEPRSFRYSGSRHSLQQDFKVPVDKQSSLELCSKSTSHPNLTGYGATNNLTSTDTRRIMRVTCPAALRSGPSHQSRGELPPLPETVHLSEASSVTASVKEEEVVVNTESIRNRTWQAKLFIIWLLIITIIVVILLAIPPPPTVPSVEFNLGFVPLGAGILTMLVDTVLNKKYAHKAMTEIDWTILLLFMGLFIWLRGFQNTRFPDDIFEKVLPVMDLSRVEGVLLFAVVIMIGSNILSNVPLVILIVSNLFCFPCGVKTCPGRLTGVLLAWISTISGNFTLIGSVANLIVAEKARICVNYRLTFWEYLKFGFFSTILVLFSGLPLVYFTGKHVNI